MKCLFLTTGQTFSVHMCEPAYVSCVLLPWQSLGMHITGLLLLIITIIIFYLCTKIISKGAPRAAELGTNPPGKQGKKCCRRARCLWDTRDTGHTDTGGNQAAPQAVPCSTPLKYLWHGS